MAVLTESKRLGDWLKWEEDNHYSRDIVTVLAGSGAERVLTTGMVLGRITKGAATGAAVAGNTGDGTITEAPTVWHDEAGSRLRVVRASLDMFVAIVRLRLLYSPFRWVVTVYDRTLGPWVHRPPAAPPS